MYFAADTTLHGVFYVIKGFEKQHLWVNTHFSRTCASESN